METGIDERTKRIIIGVISILFPTARIILYGSRARGDYKEKSDIDIAIDTGKREEFVDIGEARNMLRESNILYNIDVVDVHIMPESMRTDVIKEGIIWKN